MNFFTALCNAAAYYFKAKALAASYELQRDIEHDIDLAEQEITALRVKGDPPSQLAADRVRARVLRAQAIYVAIPDHPLVPAARVEAASERPGPDG